MSLTQAPLQHQNMVFVFSCQKATLTSSPRGFPLINPCLLSFEGLSLGGGMRHMPVL